MQFSRRSANQRSQLRRFGLHLFVLLSTVFSIFAAPLAAQAQGPRSFWIPPYRPQEVPTMDEGIVTTATVPESLSLIVDTDPGVDDAVALAWLMSVLGDEHILGIVTVAGNTTVENATANAESVLSFFEDEEVEIITGARKPLSQKLSSIGKLIHGEDGLWGQQLALSAHRSRREARNFYCTNAKNESSATILALGPLTNIAEAVRHCRRDMEKYARIVILGGAKVGGNTTPVAEFNFWQDPEAARIVFASGMNIDLVPMDAFSQFGFPALELIGFPGSEEPPRPPIPSLFAESEVEVFNYLALPVAIYAGVELQAGALVPAIPDLAGAIYAVYGTTVLGEIPNPDPETAPDIPLIPALQPALVDIIERPEAVRGQSIIGLGFVEWVTMLANRNELDQIADEAFELSGDSIFPDADYVNAATGNILARFPEKPPKVVTVLNVRAMRRAFLAELNATTASFDVQPKAEDQTPLPENLYLPSVTSE